MKTRMMLDPTQASFVRERIRLFDREAPETWQWQSTYVRTHDALPLYLGWTETLGIRPDGSLVRWSTEQEYDGWKSIDRPGECALALVRAAEQYPTLSNLVPPRPSDAEDCRSCAGFGCFPQQPELICECAGLGWNLRSVQDLGALVD
jgi:hypothetical protein